MGKLEELGINKKKIAQFEKKGIFTTEDLKRYIPREYKDCSVITGIRPETELSCVCAKVNDVKAYYRNVPVLIASCTAATGEKLQITWFNQNYLYNKIAGYKGQKVYIAAKFSYDANWKTYKASAPEIFELDKPGSRRIKPVYSKIDGMSEEFLLNTINLALNSGKSVKETLPEGIVSKYKLMPIDSALTNLHAPSSMKEVEEGQKRVIFDNLEYFALANEYANRNVAVGSPYSIKTLKLFNQIIDSLPYELTPSQRKALDDIIAKVKEGKRLSLLVNGDVGSGKSIIAFLAMALFAGSGYQTVLMAPTQILARQHYENLKALVEPFGYKVAYVDGELKNKEKKDTLKSIKDGEALFIIGTHSVFSKSVEYANNSVALVITDEEHRFGVEQRKSLVDKCALGVHSITMSATPIPRSLAQIVYGQTIEVANIKAPSSHKPVITGVAKSREKIFTFIKNQVEKDRRIYVVCPVIDANEKLENVLSVEEISEIYQKALSLYNIKVTTITGRDSKEDTQRKFNDFESGIAPVLIATTVIEVGVDCKKASGIVIESAERFGLAQLHQLRGRVGRSDIQSYCVLNSEVCNAATNNRLAILCSTNNGYEIAKEDLKIRGAGDILGIRQSGQNKYLDLVLSYPCLYEQAKEAAKEIFDNGTECELMDLVLDKQIAV